MVLTLFSLLRSQVFLDQAGGRPESGGKDPAGQRGAERHPNHQNVHLGEVLWETRHPGQNVGVFLLRKDPQQPQSTFRKETDQLKIIYYLKATILTLGGLTMKVAFFLLIMTYTLIGQSVTAETVYFTQQCFFVLRSCITTSIPMGINNLAELCAAMRR